MIGQTLSSDGGRRAAWAVAAAVAIGVVAWLLLRAPGESGGPDGAGVAGIDILEPRGALTESPRRFAWRAVPGAARYDVRIADDDAVWPLFVRSTTEAALTLPESEAGALVPGRVHVWEIDALDAAGAKLASGGARFQVLMPGTDATLPAR